MEINIELTKWGFGFYSNFLSLDFSWGFLGTTISILLIRKVLKKNNLFWYGDNK
jgi:hypothetical protein